MKAIDAALNRFPNMDRSLIIQFGCPDRWGLGERPVDCLVGIKCESCWSQEVKEGESEGDAK